MKEEIERLLKIMESQTNMGAMITNTRYALQDLAKFGYKVIDKGYSNPKSCYRLVRIIEVYGADGEELVDVNYCLKNGEETASQYAKSDILKAKLVPVSPSQLPNYFDIDETQIIYNNRRNENGLLLVKTFKH